MSRRAELDRDRRVVGRARTRWSVVLGALPGAASSRRSPIAQHRAVGLRSERAARAARHALRLPVREAERQGRDRARAASTSRRRTTTCSSSRRLRALDRRTRCSYSRPSIDVLFESARRRLRATALVGGRADRRQRRRRRRARARSQRRGGLDHRAGPGDGRAAARCRAAAIAAGAVDRGRCRSRRSRRCSIELPRRERRASRAARSVLLVDDRPENLLALEAVLEPLGLHDRARDARARRRCARCSTRTSR